MTWTPAVGRPPGDRRRLVFLFSPRASPECHIPKELYARAGFQRAWRACDAVIADQLGWSLQPGSSRGGGYQRTLAEAEFEPVVTALQIAATAAWSDEMGAPEAVAGASGGEFAAAFVAGALSLEDAMAVACCAGFAFSRGVGRGGTLAVSLSLEEAEACRVAAPPGVFLAAHYGRRSVALAGEAAAIAALRADLAGRQVRVRPVPTTMAVHTPLMDVHQAVFLDRLRGLRPRAPGVPVYSAAAGGRVDGVVFDAHHWWTVFRQTAWFAAVADGLVREGFDTFVDFGQQPVLSGAIAEAAAAAGRDVHFLGWQTPPAARSVVSVEADPASLDLACEEISRDPYPYYHALRLRTPVAYLARGGYWAVVRHADVTTVLRDPARFSSAILKSFEPALLGADPPAHTRVRRVVSEAFATRKMAALEGALRAQAAALLDAAVEKDAFDLVAEVALPLPVFMIAMLLGLPAGHLDDLQRWSRAVVVGASGRPGPDERTRLALAAAELSRFLATHVERLRVDPGDSLLGCLVAGQGDMALSSAEAVGLARLLLVAGNETTTNLIGNVVLAFLEHPAEWARVQADPALVPAAIEETLRYDPPVQIVDRITTAPVELAGVAIPAQARVGVILGAANRDPDVFPEPDTFSVARNAQEHVAFGGGPHHCLGAWLGRLETRVVIEELMARLPGLRAREPPARVERHASLHVRGPRRLMLAGA